MNLGSHFNLHGLSVKDCKECEICNALLEKKKKKTQKISPTLVNVKKILAICYLGC